MAFCQNCGSQIAQGAAFCPGCGAPVQAAPRQQYQQMPQQQYQQMPQQQAYQQPPPQQAYGQPPQGNGQGYRHLPANSRQSVPWGTGGRGSGKRGVTVSAAPQFRILGIPVSPKVGIILLVVIIAVALAIKLFGHG